MTLRTRALLAVLVLPGVVAGVVPAVLAEPWLRGPAGSIGAIPLVLGLTLLFWCVWEFYTAGKGTLAPWDPPRRLVFGGPYRLSRNPIYLAVLLVLVGWAAMFGRPALWIYATGVAVAFHLRVTWVEEPWLDRTYAGAWRAYRARVRRWL